MVHHPHPLARRRGDGWRLAVSVAASVALAVGLILAVQYLSPPRDDTAAEPVVPAPRHVALSTHVEHGALTATADLRRAWGDTPRLGARRFLFFQVDGGTYDRLPYADDHTAAAALGYRDGNASLTGYPGTLQPGSYSASVSPSFTYAGLPAGTHVLAVYALDSQLHVVGAGARLVTIPPT